MKGCLYVAVIIAMSAAIGIYSSTPQPTWDQAKLKAIGAESRLLMATHPIKPPKEWANVSEGQWPPAIASLKPFDVTVHQWGVHIGTEPYFDGGWGYGVPRNDVARKMLKGWCYSDAGQGVLWHGPC